MSLQSIQDFLSQNQLASGGLILGAVGAAAAYARNVPHQAWRWIKSRSVLTVEILDRDEVFTWFDIWLSKHEYSKKSIRLTAWCKYKDYEGPVAAGGDRSPDIIFSPSPGSHFLKYKGKWLYISKERKDKTAGGSMSNKDYKESITIQAFTRKRDIITDLLDEARDAAISKTAGIEAYIPNYDNWNLSKRVTARPLESVVLDGSVGIDIKKDMQRFLESRDWYASVGIPYRRGYLLEGASGSGKSSLALALASELGLKICILPLGGPGMNDDKLSYLMNEVPSGSIVLFEDIDCAGRATESREKENAKTATPSTTGVTLSALLNAIDGVASSDGQIVVMTTNYPDRIDPAIVRPGRVDMRAYFGMASTAQIVEIFLRFYPEALGEDAAKFAASIPNRTISMAAIQGHLIKHRDSCEEAINAVGEIAQA